MNALLRTISLLVLCELNALAADTLNDWKSVEIGKAGELTVRLRVKPSASLADEEWLAIEFENHGKSDIKIDMAQYRIESERSNLETGIFVSSGSLAHGNAHDLFPDAWDTVPIAERVVPPGVYRMIDHPSLYSSALLGLPPGDGCLVKAQVFVDLRINHERVKLEAKKFEFQWLYPDAKGFDAMRLRLLHLLANPRNAVQHAYILYTLLAVPELAQAASAQQLLAAIEPRVEAFSGRQYVLEHLNNQYAGESAVVEYFFSRIVDTDTLITEDLRSVPKVWDSRFLPALLNRFDVRHDSVSDVFVILRQQGTPQRAETQIASRLSNALLRFGWIEPGETYVPSVLAYQISLMGHTCDRNMIPRLMPYLDDKTQTIDVTQPGLSLDIRLPPLRVCDNALEAILEILDGSPGKGYKDAGFKFSSVRGARPQDVAEITEMRDKMITTVKQRLAELNGQPKEPR